MSTNLISFGFENHGVRVMTRNGEPWFVAKDVCDILEIANNRDAIVDLDDDERGVGTTDTPGGKQEMTIISESGLYSLVFKSRKPEAKTFFKWITKEVLPSIRKTGSYGVDEKTKRLETELQIYRQKMQVFEEHCPATFYSLDEVASLMQFYVKPPFGQNHLKRWLIQRNILCKQAAKNEKPIQYYIDRGWFVAVIHEWYRRGQKRTENRFYMTPRGVSGIIDLAIREKLMVLPAPKVACLPGLYDPPLPLEAGGPITITDEVGRTHTYH